MHLLLVEDDPVIGRALSQGFRESGHECTWTKDGSRGLQLAQSQQFDAVVMDLMLPGCSGLEIIADLRASGTQTPVLALTALGTVEQRVQGLNCGADDYVVKPFAFDDLMARITAVCRRAVVRPSPVLKAGELTLDLPTRRVRLGEREIELTPTEFSVLELLMRFAGQVVTRKMLCQHLWDSDWEGTTNVIEVHINRIRGKLDRNANESLIQTVRGRGYAIRSIS